AGVIATASTYSTSFGFLPQFAVGVGDGIELQSAVSFIAGEGISPTAGLHGRYFASKQLELGARTLAAFPTNGRGSVAQDFGLTLLWRTASWLAISTEARLALAYTPTVMAGFVWPLLATVQVTSGFFLGISSELLVLPDSHRVSWAPGFFLGGTANHLQHA